MPNNKRPLLKRLSLKSRLVLAAIVWLTAMVIAVGVSVPNQVFNYMVDDTKSQLTIYMDEISASLEADETGNLSLTTNLSDPRFNRPYSGLYWSAKTEKELLRSRSLWDKKITTDKKDKDYLGARNEKLIYIKTTLYYPDYDGPIDVIIGIDEQPIEDTVGSLMGQLWIILALLYLGVLAVIFLQVQWSLSPLTKMHKELSQLRSGDKTRLDQDYPKEVAPVVSDLNALVFHYQELLERARHHAGNLSHALKTPLSVLKNEISSLDNQTQSLLQPPVDQIQSQIDYHLGRARMAGSKNILSVRANPSQRVDAISMAFDKVYAQRGVTLINELDSDIDVAVDKTDLDEMVGNLLENAYKWSDSIIRVHSESKDNDDIEIIVEDDGPGIPDQDIKQAVERGVRLDETTPGTGLGLNIVSEMAHSYRGKLTLSRSSMGGLKAVLSLKLSA
ncbi:ATP-binding protein [Vibrio brasiliensis]|jgi:signal transduction histidine kinase|uniref:histidine kinase n=1 Tax=Vibrio brasiliensis LMG 20546 TaxID=945543 RepID=E8LY48_9VIBR|nr:ATP-binding protein [Vibrio brasiliensis]EGA64421.1 signal transduction histidine kinase [Vibrio brasiliensis LMG 20546]MCG9752141.1 ATP-binding protein [Vibrio brasiliensis]